MLKPFAAFCLGLGLSSAGYTLPTWTMQVDSAAVWHGNVTNADRVSDRLGALEWRTELAGDTGWQFRHGRVEAGWQLAIEAWPRFEGLNAALAGPTVRYRHKFGLGVEAPLLLAAWSGSAKAVQESARSGRGGEWQLQAQKRWGSSWRGVAGLSWNEFRARGHAFNETGRTYLLRAEYQLAPTWRCSAELKYRHGTVVSYTTPPRPDLVEAGHALTLVNTFERAVPLLAYYFPADTMTLGTSLEKTLDVRTALLLGFEYRDTKHLTVRYLNQRITVALVRRF